MKVRDDVFLNVLSMQRHKYIEFNTIKTEKQESALFERLRTTMSDICIKERIAYNFQSIDFSLD